MPRKMKSKKEPELKVEPISKNLFDDSSSEDDQEDGGVTINGNKGAPELRINEEYARRFEHNKKREELQRLEEKYKSKDGGLDESDESSTDESEDDEGFLVTEQLDEEIKATLQAIKNKDPRIYDKNAVFYQPIDPESAPQKEKTEKPVTLRDYHRERYMAGDVGADMDEDNKHRTYNQAQDDLKKSIMAEINAAADDDEEWSDDDAFIKKVEKPEVKLNEDGIHPSRVVPVKLTEVDVAKADQNPEEFLSKFMASKAWAPPEGSKWEAFNSDEDSDEDDDLADEFENAYNMRFEDPTKSNEFLKTYSRNAAAARSVRKEELKGRKKQRALEKEKKEAEKKQRDEERARLRRLKIDEAAEKLAKIKQAAGLSGKDLKDEDWARLLDDDFDENWEQEMQKQFGDEYYAEADDASAGEEEEEEGGADGEKSKKKKKPSKPTWDDDIDIKDIVPDFVDDTEAPPNISLTDDEENADVDQEGQQEDSDDDDDERPSKKRKTSKDIKKDRIAAKRQARAELAKIEALVDTKMELDNPTALAKAASKKGSKGMTGGFRYRETSPNVFGMTARDILLAPSDAALNEFAGLKKLAPFREAEKKRKDKKKLGKKARLREWRRETFGREAERTGPTWGFEGPDGASAEGPATGVNGIAAAKSGNRGHVSIKDEGDAEEKKKGVANEGGIVEGERKKKRKRSKKSKKAGIKEEDDE